MDGSHRSRRDAVFSEINITPLTDIFLVLLIIMMVVAPVLSRANRDVHPPQISGGNSVDSKNFTVEVADDGRCYIEGQFIAETDLEQVLTTYQSRVLPDAEGKKAVLILANKTARSEGVLNVLRAAESAHFDRSVLMGEAKQAPNPPTVPEQQQ